jgi:hypothetical protein
LFVLPVVYMLFATKEVHAPRAAAAAAFASTD